MKIASRLFFLCCAIVCMSHSSITFADSQTKISNAKQKFIFPQTRSTGIDDQQNPQINSDHLSSAKKKFIFPLRVKGIDAAKHNQNKVQNGKKKFIFPIPIIKRKAAPISDSQPRLSSDKIVLVSRGKKAFIFPRGVVEKAIVAKKDNKSSHGKKKFIFPLPMFKKGIAVSDYQEKSKPSGVKKAFIFPSKIHFTSKGIVVEHKGKKKYVSHLNVDKKGQIYVQETVYTPKIAYSPRSTLVK